MRHGLPYHSAMGDARPRSHNVEHAGQDGPRCGADGWPWGATMTARLRLFGPDDRHNAKRKAGLATYRWYIIDQAKDVAGRWRRHEQSTGCGLDERAEAERKLGEYLISRHDPRPNGPRDPAALSIADCLTIYLREHVAHVAAPERVGYAVRHLLAFWGELQVSAITGATCRRYIASRNGAAASTIRQEMIALQAAVNWCHREGYLTQAPVVIRPQVGQRQPRVLSRAEVAALICAARSVRLSRDHLPLFIMVGIYTGKREAAIRHLQWQPNTEGDGWIDLDRKMIHWGDGSGNKRRGDPTPIPRPLLTFLRYRARRGGKYIFSLPASKGSAPTRLGHSWATALRKSGIPHARMHDMRHTAASVMLCRGIEPWLAAQYLGMSVQVLTRVYGHMIPGALEAAARAVGGK